MLPTGTVTFLMTDVEGSTRLVERLGEDWDAVQLGQRALVRAAVRGHGGAEIDVHGDEVFASFAQASAAAAAAREIQRALAAEPWAADAGHSSSPHRRRGQLPNHGSRNGPSSGGAGSDSASNGSAAGAASGVKP